MEYYGSSVNGSNTNGGVVLKNTKWDRNTQILQKYNKKIKNAKVKKGGDDRIGCSMVK